MDTKNLKTQSRLLVNKILLEPNISKYLQLLAKYHEKTLVHSLNVAYLSSEISMNLGISEEIRKDIIRGALLHDIGKTKISCDILDKKDTLTVSEWHLLQKHTILGHEMIKDEDFSDTVKDIVLLHHEKLNGSGYPYGYNKEQIPLTVQLITIMDIYDALTEKRCYGKKHNSTEAFIILYEEPLNNSIVEVLKTCPDK